MNRSILIGAITISAAILVNGFLERRAHVMSTVSAVATSAVPLPARAIAVLPFENLSEEKTNASFADGVQREIITHLSAQHVRAAGVREAPSVGQLLVGSVQHAGDRVRINVQFADAVSRIPLWTATYDRELSDVFAVQSEIAENVAKAVAAPQKK